jgi:hypothetical protein
VFASRSCKVSLVMSFPSFKLFVKSVDTPTTDSPEMASLFAGGKEPFLVFSFPEKYGTASKHPARINHDK